MLVHSAIQLSCSTLTYWFDNCIVVLFRYFRYFGLLDVFVANWLKWDQIFTLYIGIDSLHIPRRASVITRFRQMKRRTGAMTPYNFVLPRCLSLSHYRRNENLSPATLAGGFDTYSRRDKRGRYKEGFGGRLPQDSRPSQ